MEPVNIGIEATVVAFGVAKWDMDIE